MIDRIHKTGRVIFIALLAIAVLGCRHSKDEDPAPDNHENPGYSIDLNADKDVYIYAPTAVEFAAPVFINPDDVKVTVTNNGTSETGDLLVRLFGADKDLFEVSPAKIGNLAAGASAEITVKVPKLDPRRQAIFDITLAVGNDDVGRKVSIFYNVFVFKDESAIDITPSTGELVLQPGVDATVSAGSGAGKQNTMVWFSSNPSVAVIDEASGALKALASGMSVIGFIEKNDSGKLTVKGKKVTVYPEGELGPIMQSAKIDGTGDAANCYKMVITYQKAPLAASGAGFSVSGGGSAITFSSPVVNASNKTLTLKMSRSISAQEAGQNILFLNYDGGDVSDSESHIGVSGSVHIALTNVTVNLGTNIAPQKSGVTATDNHSAHNVSNLVDGDDTTRWATNSSTRACTATITFAAAKTVNVGVLKSYNTRITEFEILYFDGTADQRAYYYKGTAVPGTTGGTTVPFTCIFDSTVTSTRFKLHIIAASADPSIWEFELYNAQSGS
ncbi:hypothetical protein AGMMS50267_08880 [Spirochaetia bacterium]|nr:hypothetical protein AGMMS50267_08880 [Spirochaetia bacterium]